MTDEITPTEVVWQTRPSIFLHTGTYLVTVVIIYCLVKVQYFLTPYPWAMMWYTPWTQPLVYWSLRDWPVIAVAVCYGVMLIALLNALLKLAKTRFTRYSLMNDQLVVRRFLGFGVVEYRTEMYRMVDFMQTQMMFGGVFGFSTLIIRSTDANKPVIKLQGVRNAQEVIEKLRSETERCRQKKHIQEYVSPQMTSPPGRNV